MIHQTKIDHKMPYRIVISKVLYTGKQKWNVKKYIEEVQERLEGYEEIKLAKYDVVDVNYKKHAKRKITN